jgi:hypothetical protein
MIGDAVSDDDNLVDGLGIDDFVSVQGPGGKPDHG